MACTGQDSFERTSIELLIVDDEKLGSSSA